MTIEEETHTGGGVEPLFLNSHHLLIAVVATIAAEHGISLTRELIDELAEDDATWDAIAEKLGARHADDVDEGQGGNDTETPPDHVDGAHDPLAISADESLQAAAAGALKRLQEEQASEAEALLSSDGIDSAGPDATGPAVVETNIEAEPFAGDVPTIEEPPSPALVDANGNGAAPRGRRGKKSAHP